MMLYDRLCLIHYPTNEVEVGKITKKCDILAKSYLLLQSTTLHFNTSTGFFNLFFSINELGSKQSPYLSENQSRCEILLCNDSLMDIFWERTSLKLTGMSSEMDPESTYAIKSLLADATLSPITWGVTRRRVLWATWSRSLTAGLLINGGCTS